MDLLTELNRVLLESKEPYTVATIEVRSPLDPPMVSYRYRPPQVRTTYLPKKGDEKGGKKGDWEQYRHRKMLRKSTRKSFVDLLIKLQQEGLQRLEAYSATQQQGLDPRALGQKRVYTSDEGGIVHREAVLGLTMPREQAVWEKEKERLKRRIHKEIAEKEAEKKVWEFKPATPENIRTKQKALLSIKRRLSDLKDEKSNFQINMTMRRVPLGITYEDFLIGDYNNFNEQELISAVEAGYRGALLHNILRNIKDPVMAQVSRDFDSMVAITIQEIFLDDDSSFDRMKARAEASANGPRRMFVNGKWLKTDRFISSHGKRAGVMTDPLSHPELFTLLANGFRVKEIQRNLSNHYMETRQTEEGYEGIWNDNPEEGTLGIDVVKNSVTRIMGDLDKYFVLDNMDLDKRIGTYQIQGLHSDWLSPEDLHKHPIIQQQMLASIKNPGDEMLRPSKDKPTPRHIWDMPREAGDTTPRISDEARKWKDKQEIPKFVWVTLTGFEGSDSSGIEADPQLSKYYGQPVAYCPVCGGGFNKKEKNVDICSGCDRVWSIDQKKVGQAAMKGEGEKVKCKRCEGTGKIRERCTSCHGRLGTWRGEQLCDKCEDGWEDPIDCPACDGEGFVDRSRNLSVASGVVPAWYWANDPDYSKIPFYTIYTTVYHALTDKYGREVTIYDGVKGFKEGAELPEPWHVKPPGQKRPMLSENVPAYVVIFRVPFEKDYFGRDFERQIRNHNNDITNKFRPFLEDILASPLKSAKFELEISGAGASAAIKSEKIEVGYEELLGGGRDWSSTNQPSSRFVRDAFTLYKVANFLDKIGKSAPYLWKALSINHKSNVKMDVPLPDVAFKECLARSIKHLREGLSYQESAILRGEAWGHDKEGLQAKLEVGSSFPGKDKTIHDLENIIEQANIYDYTFNDQLPTRVRNFMRSQIALQSIYDSHVFGRPQQRSQQKADEAAKAGGRSGAGAKLADEIYHGVVSTSTVNEGGFHPREGLSKREYILTVARRIERILEYANIQHRNRVDPDKIDGDWKNKYSASSWHMPHYNLKLAMGLTHDVPDPFIENNVQSRMYEVVDTANLDTYARYLLEDVMADDPEDPLRGRSLDPIRDASPDHVRKMLFYHGLDMTDMDSLKVFYCAQKPQLALLHLNAAMSDIEAILEDNRPALKDVHVVFYSEGKKGKMEVGRLVPGRTTRIETESGIKTVKSKKGFFETDGASVLEKCYTELKGYQVYASKRLEDGTVKRRQRAAEERARHEIETGGERGDYLKTRSRALNVKMSAIDWQPDRYSEKDKAEVELFVSLRQIFTNFADGYWAPSNDYGSLYEIKDKFVSWFKKQNSNYNQDSRYDKLDIGQLLGSEGINFSSVGIKPDEGMKIIKEMTELCQEIRKLGADPKGHTKARRMVESILREK